MLKNRLWQAPHEGSCRNLLLPVVCFQVPKRLLKGYIHTFLQPRVLVTFMPTSLMPPFMVSPQWPSPWLLLQATSVAMGAPVLTQPAFCKVTRSTVPYFHRRQTVQGTKFAWAGPLLETIPSRLGSPSSTWFRFSFSLSVLPAPDLQSWQFWKTTQCKLFAPGH